MDVTIIDEPLQARVHRLASPAFPVAHPELHGRQLMPAEIYGSMHASWSAGVIGVRAIDFYRLSNVFVCAEGLVFDSEGRLYRASIGQYSEEQIAAAASALHVSLANGNVHGHGGPAVLCKKTGSFNYGHWMLEMLPRAVLGRREIGLAGLRYIVQHQTGAMRRVVWESLMLAGIRPDDVLETTSAPMFCADLFLIDGVAQHGRYMSPLALSCLDPMIAAIPAGQAERLYVTRRNVGVRKFSNEATLCRLAEREGFMVIDPGEMPVAQQIGIFKGARRAVGVIGAGMTNAAFMPKGGRLRLFVPAGMPDNFFWFISQIRGHAYAEYRCPELAHRRAAGGQAWDTDLTIKPEAFRRFLNG